MDLTNDYELCNIDKTTGEIEIYNNQEEYHELKTIKIKLIKLLAKNDFKLICNKWEIKGEALTKILSSLSISYSIRIINSKMNNTYVEVTSELSVCSYSIVRKAESIGICEISEAGNYGGLYNIYTCAENRALKKSIEKIFGRVIEYFILTYLV